MKYSLHLDIERPREQVIQAFNNPDNLPLWQPDLIEFEPLEGIPGQPGSKMRLVYRLGKREMELVGTVTRRELPDLLACQYESRGLVDRMTHRFEERGNVTRWHSDHEFIANGWLQLVTWLLPGAFRKETLKRMQRFKRFAETGERQP